MLRSAFDAEHGMLFCSRSTLSYLIPDICSVVTYRLFTCACMFLESSRGDMCANVSTWVFGARSVMA